MTDTRATWSTGCAGAVNGHDLDALAACFAADYRNETPVHPARGFVGRDQVRRNWEQLFGGIPDLAGTITRARRDAGRRVDRVGDARYPARRRGALGCAAW